MSGPRGYTRARRERAAAPAARDDGPAVQVRRGADCPQRGN